MSKGRMEDLLAALRAAGWILLTEKEYPRASTDPFSLEDESIRWAISRGNTDTVVELEFQAFGDLGKRTNRLQDILCCIVRDRRLELVFAKRETAEWKERLVKFVRSLEELGPRADPGANLSD